MYEKCIRERLETKNKTEDDIINVKDKKKKKESVQRGASSWTHFFQEELKAPFLGTYTQVYACLHMENACLIMVSQNCCVFHRPMLWIWSEHGSVPSSSSSHISGNKPPVTAQYSEKTGMQRALFMLLLRFATELHWTKESCKSAARYRKLENGGSRSLAHQLSYYGGVVFRPEPCHRYRQHILAV